MWPWIQWLGRSTRAWAWGLFWLAAGWGLLGAEKQAGTEGNEVSPRDVPITAHVVIVEDSAATVTFEPVHERVQSMVNRGITMVTGKSSPGEAWRSLVSPKDVVGLKIYTAPGAASGTRLAVVEAIARGLLEAGHPPTNLVLWDKRLTDLRRAGFEALAKKLGVQVAGSADEGYEEKVFYENNVQGQLMYGDLEFGRRGEKLGRKSYVTRLLTQKITRIINVPPLLNHHQAGVVGNLYSLAVGSTDNTMRFEGSPQALATSIPEIYALPELGDRVALNIVDALIVQYLGAHDSLLHYSVALNQLRFSTDPVALDVLSVKELERQRQLAKVSSTPANPDLFRNASLLELGISQERSIFVETVK